MSVSLPGDKLTRLILTLTSTWHPFRKSFTLLEGVTLLGHLEHASSICSWGRHLYDALRSAVNYCLRSCTREVYSQSQVNLMVAEIRNASSPDEAFLIDRFNKRKIAKSIYACKKPCFITVELRQELDFLSYILSNPQLYI